MSSHPNTLDELEPSRRNLICQDRQNKGQQPYTNWISLIHRMSMTKISLSTQVDLNETTVL